MSASEYFSASERSDMRALKRAYARLIKVHSPQSDPAAFQAIRQQYEHALAAIRAREASEGTAEASADAAEAGGEPSLSQPPAPSAMPAHAEHAPIPPWVDGLDLDDVDGTLQHLTTRVAAGEAEALRYGVAIAEARAPEATVAWLASLEVPAALRPAYREAAYVLLQLRPGAAADPQAPAWLSRFDAAARGEVVFAYLHALLRERRIEAAHEALEAYEAELTIAGERTWYDAAMVLLSTTAWWMSERLLEHLAARAQQLGEPFGESDIFQIEARVFGARAYQEATRDPLVPRALFPQLRRVFGPRPVIVEALRAIREVLCSAEARSCGHASLEEALVYLERVHPGVWYLVSLMVDQVSHERRFVGAWHAGHLAGQNVDALVERCLREHQQLAEAAAGPEADEVASLSERDRNAGFAVSAACVLFSLITLSIKGAPLAQALLVALWVVVGIAAPIAVRMTRSRARRRLQDSAYEALPRPERVVVPADSRAQALRLVRGLGAWPHELAFFAARQTPRAPGLDALFRERLLPMTLSGIDDPHLHRVLLEDTMSAARARAEQAGDAPSDSPHPAEDETLT